MKYWSRLSAAALIILLLGINCAAATKVYMTDLDITSQVGGTRYWQASLNPGDGSAAVTRVSLKQNSPGSSYYRPGQSAPEGTSTMTDSPKGYGWATGTMPTDIPAGTWSFKVTTKNSRSEDSGGKVTVYVFKSCGGTNTKLFSVQGTTEAASSTGDVSQVITTSQPDFAAQNCLIKFEYWLTITNVEEDTSNTLQKIATADFYVDFPGSLNPSACTDADNDGYQASSCGGDDCNDNSNAIHPGATETCNNIDDDCDTQKDENLQQQMNCGVGACHTSVTQTCSAGAFLPICTPGTPGTEICANSLDDDCDGQIDEGCTCTPGSVQQCGTNIGVCEFGNQTCQQDGIWGQCSGGIAATAEICNSLDDNCNGNADEGLVCNNCTNAAEICNGLDDNCNNQTDENLQQTVACGSGSCKITVLQTCINGIFSPACIPGQPAAEICNGFDDNCNNQTDEALIQQCGINIGECRPGSQTCTKGKWSGCTGGVAPLNETCDFKDNNCDGRVDEEDVCKSDIAPPCTEDWACGNWTDCINKTFSSRECTDRNMCNTTNSHPSVSRQCLPEGIKAEDVATDGRQNVNEKTLLAAALIGSIAIMLRLAWKISKEKIISEGQTSESKTLPPKEKK